MWSYEKKLQYPVNIKNPNPKLAMAIISQLGGPDGELAASLRYLNQRYVMPYGEVKGLLTDIGTEELAHVEVISAILYQLTRNLSIDEIKACGFDTYFVDHTTGIYPIAASGTPFTASYFQSKGDIITDLMEDLAADGAIMQRLRALKVAILRCFKT
ncbi:MAG: manganese catalase family protein [Alistipes sp.]|nr:manganese catalase family protein [Alistipes sp.]